jgi:hypothetical protein
LRGDTEFVSHRELVKNQLLWLGDEIQSFGTWTKKRLPSRDAALSSNLKSWLVKGISSTAARKALTVIKHLRGTLKVASGLVVVHPAPVDWSLVHPLLLTRNPVAGPAVSVGLAGSIKLAKTATLTPDLGLMPVYSEGTTPDVKPPLVT